MFVILRHFLVIGIWAILRCRGLDLKVEGQKYQVSCSYINAFDAISIHVEGVVDGNYRSLVGIEPVALRFQCSALTN